MNTVAFENKGGIKMIAHRGVSGIERENTCPAFLLAGAKTYYGIETDVHITKDGKFILCHDSDLMRVAGVDLVIEETDFDTLRAVRFTDRGTEFVRGDIFLPTLEEYMHICKKYEKRAVLEIKTDFSEEDVVRLIGTIRDCGMLENTTFISFIKSVCLKIKKNYPEADIQVLSGVCGDEAIDFCIEHGFDADFNYEKITKETVDRLHAAGLSVNAWTVNRLEDAERLKEYGVDYITSNILE